MSQIGEAWRKLIFLLRRPQMDRELEEEMRQHAALKTQKNIAAGMEPEEADYAARRQLGNLTRQREESRQNWGFPFLESIVQDIRYGLRGLRNAPGFTTVAALTLALGIGSCTAIFSIVNAVLLRPLPYKDSSRMVHVWAVIPMLPNFRLPQSLPNVNDIKALGRSFEATTLYNQGRQTLTGSGDPEQLSTAAVASDFFAFFSVHPVQGHEFVPADERINGDVALLSYGLWQRRFAGDARIVGSRISLEQKPYTVVGVLPAKFSFPEKTDLWVPLAMDAKEQSDRTSVRYSMLAKVRSGVSPKSAQSELDGIATRIASQYPEEAAGIKFSLETLQRTSVNLEKAELLALTGAVGFLLLIACANVSNLVLSRGIKRQREIALRAALGASRARIVRQLLIESLLLACAGGLAGSSLAAWGIDAFRALVPTGFPRLDELRAEPATILIACAITAFTGILCGLAPALSASRANLNPALKEKTAATATGRRFSLRGFLVVTEIALALVLLTGSALMVQSLVRILKVDPGLRTDHVLSATVSLPKVRYATDDAFRLFARRLLDALRAQPQFNRVAISNTTVMKNGMSVMILDRPSLAALGLRDETLNLETRSVSAGFFETLSIPLVRGRFFNDHDVKGAPPVIIINDSMARRFFPGQDPMGRMFKPDAGASDQYQVVGQVRDTLDGDLQDKQQLQIYFPLFQVSDEQNFLNILMHTTAEPSTAIAFLRRAVASVDKDQPLTEVHTIAQAISESVAQPRFRARMLSAFAFAGLALTLIGIYGVISYSVGQRTQEMGIRMALGARPWNVLRLVLREGLVLALSGAVCGVLGSFMLMRLLANQLFSIKPSDPPTLIGAALLMLIVALAASYIPARRATKVDPMIALRYE